MMLGYHNLLLMLLRFVSLDAETLFVKPKSNLTLQLDRNSTNVRQVTIYKGGNEMASSRNVLNGWDDYIDNDYKSRLSLNSKGIMAIILKTLERNDTGKYISTVIFENGDSLLKHWDITVKDVCKVRSQSNLRLELDLNSTTVREISLTMNASEIASSRNVKTGWDETHENYTTRCHLSVTANGVMTIHLENVTIIDKGTYRLTVLLQNEELIHETWAIEVEESHLEINVSKQQSGKYHCKCGYFKGDEIRELSYKWNITHFTNHTLECSKNISVKCSAEGPVEGCPDLIQNQTAEHTGEKCSRKKRSTEICSDCTPAKSTEPGDNAEDTSSEAPGSGTTDDREHPSTVNSVAIAVPVAVVVIIIIATVVVCVLRYCRRKDAGKKNQSESEAEQTHLGQKDNEEETENE